MPTPIGRQPSRAGRASRYAPSRGGCSGSTTQRRPRRIASLASSSGVPTVVPQSLSGEQPTAAIHVSKPRSRRSSIGRRPLGIEPRLSDRILRPTASTRRRYASTPMSSRLRRPLRRAASGLNGASQSPSSACGGASGDRRLLRFRRDCCRMRTRSRTLVCSDASGVSAIPARTAFKSM